MWANQMIDYSIWSGIISRAKKCTNTRMNTHMSTTHEYDHMREHTRAPRSLPLCKLQRPRESHAGPPAALDSPWPWPAPSRIPRSSPPRASSLSGPSRYPQGMISYVTNISQPKQWCLGMSSLSAPCHPPLDCLVSQGFSLRCPLPSLHLSSLPSFSRLLSLATPSTGEPSLHSFSALQGTE